MPSSQELTKNVEEQTTGNKKNKDENVQVKRDSVDTSGNFNVWISFRS